MLCGALPGRTKETAKDVAGFIREGLTVERMDTEQVRVTLRGCGCPKVKQLDLSEATP